MHSDARFTPISQLIQKLFRRDQIGGAETLRKAVVDRLEAGDGVGGAALIAQQAGEARRGAQLPGQRLLPARPIERLPEEILRRFRGCRSALQQKKLALEAQQLGVQQPASDCSIPASSIASPSAIRPAWAKASAS